MVIIRLIFLLGIGIIVYWAIRKLSSGFGKPSSPDTSVILPPSKNEIDISIDGGGKDGMPVITVRSSGTSLNIQSVKQESGQYIVSADKRADNVVVIAVNKKT